LFTTYRLYRKQTTQVKNRIHSLLKEKLYGFTQEEIFDRNDRERIRGRLCQKSKINTIRYAQ